MSKYDFPEAAYDRWKTTAPEDELHREVSGDEEADDPCLEEDWEREDETE